MPKIFTIGTMHSIGGACSSDALLKIIQEISPNIIFCEASAEKFPAMLKATNSFNIPEIKALRAINELRSIEIVPIDLDDDPLDRRLEAMLELFNKKINERYHASRIQFNEANLKGFRYLNSKDCDQIFSDIDSMEKIFVSRVNHPELARTHKDWLQWNDKRENHWIDTIHDYVNQNQINVAVFLVGAAHRIRLMEKVKSVSSDMIIPDWDFYPFK